MKLKYICFSFTNKIGYSWLNVAKNDYHLKHKSIKKLFKILIIFFLSVLAIPLAAFLLLQNNHIQNFVAQKATEKLSAILGTEVKLKSLSFDIFNQLVINDLYIKDKYSDTLLFSQKLTFSIDAINFSKKLIRIEKVELDHAHFRLFIGLKTVNEVLSGRCS